MPAILDLVELLRVRAQSLGDRQAYGFLADGERETGTLSYAALDAAARGLAGRLLQRIVPGSHVILAYPPGLEFIIAFFGCLYAGMTAVPVCPPHPRRGHERLAAIAADCGARDVLTTVAARRAVVAAASHYPALAGVDCIASDDCDDAGPYLQPRAPASPDSIAFLQYTSGSTRSPRGVRVTHANVLANLAAIHAAEANDAASRGVSWLPSYHDMGLIEGILQPLYGAFPTWLLPHAAFVQRPIRWLQAISRLGATVSGGPNFAYDACVRRIADDELDAIDLASWRVAYCGAEPVRADTLEAFSTRFRRCGFKAQALRPVYGLAEATLLVTAADGNAAGPTIRYADRACLERGRFQAAPARDAAVALVSCGKPAAGSRLVVVDAQTQAMLPEGSVGELWVSGPSVARGYHADVDASEQIFRHATMAGEPARWLCTGDLGFLLDGELYVSGRSKDVIIVRGRKLHPHDIEHTVRRIQPPRLEGVAAFALEHDAGEAVGVLAEVAGVELAQAATGSAWAHLADAIRGEVYRQHDVAIATLAFVRAGMLPRTSSGKLMRFRCRQDLASARLPLIARFDVPSATNFTQRTA